jgi:hypothetical protein
LRQLWPFTSLAPDSTAQSTQLVRTTVPQYTTAILDRPDEARERDHAAHLSANIEAVSHKQSRSSPSPTETHDRTPDIRQKALESVPRAEPPHKAELIAYYNEVIGSTVTTLEGAQDRLRNCQHIASAVPFGHPDAYSIKAALRGAVLCVAAMHRYNVLSVSSAERNRHEASRPRVTSLHHALCRNVNYSLTCAGPSIDRIESAACNMLPERVGALTVSSSIR